MGRPLAAVSTFVLACVVARGAVPLPDIERLDQLPWLVQGARTCQTSSREPSGGNDDRRNYLYTDGAENVLLDVVGPGRICRIWFTGHDTTESIRFYFDGAATPDFDMTIADFFAGATVPFLAPLVGDDTVSSGGFYCYVPMPFAAGCKIVSTSPDTALNYYNITYQVFADATGVTTFTGSEDTASARAAWSDAGVNPAPAAGATVVSGTATLGAGGTLVLAQLTSPGVIRSLELKPPGLVAGSPGTTVTDEGRAFTGYSEFTVAVDDANTGVRLTRRLDYGIADQKANVLVDGAAAGEWFTPGGASGGTWLDSTFVVPPAMVAGKSSVTVRVVFVSAAIDWNEFHYWVESLVGTWQQTDELDVGDAASETDHGYVIDTAAWAGTRTYQYQVAVDEDMRDVLRETRIEAFWDGDAQAAVDAPLADFFGCARGPVAVNALPVGMQDDRLYCYFPMPFASSALVRLVSDGATPIDDLEFTVRWQPLAAAPAGVGRFNAAYRSETPTVTGSDYVFLDETGSGHLVGIVQTMRGQTTSRWYLEGDERIYIDGSLTPALYGTGTEDFYNGGWYFNQGPFALPVHGNPSHDITDTRDATTCYRFFLSDAIYFTESIRVGIEKGGSNEVTPDMRSVAYYYKAAASSLVTDELDVGDAAAETAHAYVAAGQTWSGSTTDTYEGDDDGVDVTDDGERHTGICSFTVQVGSNNAGVLLRRRMDYSVAHQRAEVFVDNVAAGTWYDAGGNATHVWRDSELLVPPALTVGKSSITVRIEPDASAAWTAYRYWAVSLLAAGPGATADADGDGLSDLDEAGQGTDPYGADSDGDGMADGWELDEGFDPLVDDGGGDADVDGHTNLDEYLAGTDPNDPASVPGADDSGPSCAAGTAAGSALMFLFAVAGVLSMRAARDVRR